MSDTTVLKTRSELTSEQVNEMKLISERLHPRARVYAVCEKGFHFMRETEEGYHVCDICSSEEDGMAQCEGCGLLMCSHCWSVMTTFESDEIRFEKHSIEMDRCDAFAEAARILCKTDRDRDLMIGESQEMRHNEMEYQRQLDEFHQDKESNSDT